MADLEVGQVVVLVGGAVGAAVAGYFAARKSPSSDPTNPMSGGSGLHFDGPLMQLLNGVQGIYRNSVEIRNESAKAVDGIRGDLGEIIDLLRVGGVDRSRSRRRR